MKSFLAAVSILMLVVVVSACGDNKKKGVQFDDRNARAGNVSTRAASVYPNRLVYGYYDQNGGKNQSSAEWMDAVRRLVSASIPEDYLLDVSQDGTNQTGVYMASRLCMQQAGTGGSQTIPSNAMVVLHVYDSREAPPVPIFLNGAAQAGSYNAQTGALNAHFQDSFGEITLVGQNYNGTFSLQVWFNNHVRFDGSADTEGNRYLGTAFISAQELFSCY